MTVSQANRCSTLYCGTGFHIRAGNGDPVCARRMMSNPEDDVYFSTNRLMLGTRVAHFADIGLTEGGMRMLVNPNAGGSSKYSEILSYEILRSMYAARLVWSEMELRYFPAGGKITDYSAEVFGHYVGVS